MNLQKKQLRLLNEIAKNRSFKPSDRRIKPLGKQFLANLKLLQNNEKYWISQDKLSFRGELKSERIKEQFGLFNTKI